MPLNKYACYTVLMCATDCYCSLHLDLTLKKQQTVTLIYHAIAIYVPPTNMPFKWNTYSTYIYKFRCRYLNTIPVFITHINSLQSTISQQTMLYIHFTLFAYAPKQICLPHHTHPTALVI